MRIIGKQKRDFYDGLARDTDPVVYVRKQEIIPIKYDYKNMYMSDPIVKRIEIPKYFKGSWGSKLIINSISAHKIGKTRFSNDRINIGKFMILFCGNIFVGYAIRESQFDEPEYVYSIEEVNKVLNSNGYAPLDKNDIYSIDDFKLDFNDIHMKYNCPVMMIYHTAFETCDDIVVSPHYNNTLIRLVLNPNLSDLNFQKVMNNREAYQEIEMYLSNILVSDKMPENPISDKLKAESHGFDKKSFRKEPSKKKK